MLQVAISFAPNKINKTRFISSCVSCRDNKVGYFLFNKHSAIFSGGIEIYCNGEYEMKLNPKSFQRLIMYHQFITAYPRCSRFNLRNGPVYQPMLLRPARLFIFQRHANVRHFRSQNVTCFLTDNTESLFLKESYLRAVYPNWTYIIVPVERIAKAIPLQMTPLVGRWEHFQRIFQVFRSKSPGNLLFPLQFKIWSKTELFLYQIVYFAFSSAATL